MAKPSYITRFIADIDSKNINFHFSSGYSAFLSVLLLLCLWTNLLFFDGKLVKMVHAVLQGDIVKAWNL